MSTEDRGRTGERSNPRAERRPARGRALFAGLFAGFLLSSGASLPAGAFELLDGRFEAHGFFESQLRVLNEDFSEDWDVAQWYQVLNVEIELDIIDDTTMGIDLLSAFVRLEVRYDCVYSQGCGMFDSINAYGDDAQSLPRRLSNGDEEYTAGELFIREGDRLSGATTDPVRLDGLSGFRLISETEGQTLYTTTEGNQIGQDQFLAPEPGEGCERDNAQYHNCFVGPKPFTLNFDDFEDFKFTQIKTRTGAIARLGPWLPKNKIDAIATMSHVPNPFDSTAINEVLFVGYVDHEGFRTDYLNLYENEDFPLPPGVPAASVGDIDATLVTDPTVNVRVNMKYPDRADELVGLRLPNIKNNVTPALPEADTDKLFMTLDDSGRGSIGDEAFLISLDYPKLGVGGLGAKPFRPTSIVDNDEAFYYGDDVEEIELNLDCEETSTGGSRCYVREVGATITYNSDDKPVDLGNFNVKFQDYYRELQVANRTVCQTGEMGCFERVFREEMEDEGYGIACGALGEGCGVSLSSVIEEAFEEIESLDCLESEWNCSDQLLASVESTLAQLEADGATLTCRDGVDCDVDISKYVIRFGTHYVISATRSDSVARGNFIPTQPLKDLIDSGRLEKLPFNFSESERAWNRGYAQNDEKELKEAYLDIELMDSRLWLRIGKQSIVWGKTELFRTTDQFNPQDLALASLPSLEESRINLWAFRAVYSLYEIGPLSDVRVELAFNFDDFQASDFGACGEAFTPNIVCQLTLGVMVHGMTGVGVAGVVTPPYRWYDPRGWEMGARIEWRWDRFSFALTDFWGDNDLPTVEFITQFERNVDPFSGRPRRMGYDGRCDQDQQDIITTRGAAGLDVDNTDSQGFIDAIIADGSDGAGRPTVLAQYQEGNVQESCLRPGPTYREPYLADLPTDQDLSDLVGAALEIRQLREVPGVINPLSQRLPVNNSYRAFIEGNALDEHHANLNFFTWVCSATVGFLTLDPNACAQTIFGSTRDVGGVGPIALLIGALVGGQPGKNNLLTFLSGSTSDFLPVSLPVVSLDSPINADPNFPSTIAKRVLENYGCWDPQSAEGDFDPANIQPGSPDYVGCGQAEGKLTKSLTPEQEALLGCGPFFGTNCDFSGLDLLNAEASAMLQSFVGIEGTTRALEIFRKQMKAAGREDVDIYFRTDGWIPFLEREKAGDQGEDDPLLIDLVDPLLQPGTVRWRQAGIDTPVCTTGHLGGRKRKDSNGRWQTAPERLPGCRGLTGFSTGNGTDTAAQLVEDHARAVGEFSEVVPYIFGNSIVDEGDNVGQINSGIDPDQLYFINEDYFHFHAYVAPEDAQRDADGNIIDTNLDGIPDHRYPGVLCSPDIDSPCFDALKDFDNRPEYHNQWDEGYRLDVDGSPFPLSLTTSTGTAVLRLPGEFNTSSLTDQDRSTPNCPTCPELRTGQLKSNSTNSLGAGHPLTGDLFNNEMAGFSFNFMMMLVAFDEDFQLIMDTITSGPTGNTAVLPREIGLSYTEPWYKNGPPIGQVQGSCHEDVRSTAPDQINRDAENQIICGVERRRFAVHYAFSGDEWGTRDPDEEFEDPYLTEIKGGTPFNLTYEYVENRFVGMEILEADSIEGSGEFIKAGAHCSFITPQHCSIIQNIFAIAGVQNRSLKAGGNGEYGRRTFIWHSGGEVIAKFDRRNVLGLAVDFAEDVTKSNWGVEFTWVEGVRVGDYDEWDGLTTVDDYNLTVSMDRPTFINFLNPNKTFFLNTQWFFQYRDGYRKSMPSNGPINVLGLIFVQTGYFQDRLLPGVIGVYDFLSRSGAVLPQVTYRYTENFSIVVGANVFMGREQLHEMPLAGIGPASNQRGQYAYQVGVENGIALVRDRDEVFMRLRYTF